VRKAWREIFIQFSHKSSCERISEGILKIDRELMKLLQGLGGIDLFNHSV